MAGSGLGPRWSASALASLYSISTGVLRQAVVLLWNSAYRQTQALDGFAESVDCIDGHVPFFRPYRRTCTHILHRDAAYPLQNRRFDRTSARSAQLHLGLLGALNSEWRANEALSEAELRAGVFCACENGVLEISASSVAG